MNSYAGIIPETGFISKKGKSPQAGPVQIVP
jgi:hypothetical protein